jgi:hypothetical protein
MVRPAVAGRCIAMTGFDDLKLHFLGAGHGAIEVVEVRTRGARYSRKASHLDHRSARDGARLSIGATGGPLCRARPIVHIPRRRARSGRWYHPLLALTSRTQMRGCGRIQSFSDPWGDWPPSYFAFRLRVVVADEQVVIAAVGSATARGRVPRCRGAPRRKAPNSAHA